MNMISTGSFLTETGASNKQSELVKKLTAAWEKKNSKTARAGGASLMALSLAACGGEDNTPFAQSDIDAAVAAAEAPLQEAVAAAEAAQAAAEADAAAALVAQAAAEADAAAALVAQAAAEADAAAALVVQAAAEADAATALVAQAAAEADAAAATVAAAEATAAKETAEAAQATAEAAQATAEASLATAQADLTAKTAEYDALVASNATLQAQYNDLIDGSALAYTNSTTADALIGTIGDDTITAALGTYANTDSLTDVSTTDNDTVTITHNAAMTPNITSVENVNLNINSTGAAQVTASSLTGVNTLTVTRGDVTVGSATIAGNKTVDVTAVDAADVGTIVAGAGTTTVDVTQATTTGITVNADNASGNVTVAGAATISANGAGAGDTVQVTASAAAAVTTEAVENAKAVNVDTTAAIVSILDGGGGELFDGAISITANSATTVGVANATGGLTLSATADDAQITVGNIDASGATITVGTGVATAGNSDIDLFLDGTTATTDVATIAGAGAIDLDANTAHLIETVNLSGTTGAVDYNMVSSLPTVINLTGSQSVTVSQTADGINGLDLNNNLTAGTATVAINTAASGAVVATAVAADNFIVEADAAFDNTTEITVATGSTFTIAADQTGFDVIGSAAGATISIATADDTAANGTPILIEMDDIVASSNITTVNIDATVGAFDADSITLATTAALNLSGTQNFDLGNATSASVTSTTTGTVTLNTANAALDAITTGSGADNLTLDEGTAVMVLDAGAGNDIVSAGNAAASQYDLGLGNDQITLTNANAGVVSAGDGDDLIITDQATDMIIAGGDGSDTLRMTGGANVNVSGNANFALSSIETINLSAASTGLQVSAAQFNANSTFALTGTAAATDILTVTGSASADTVSLANVTVTNASTSITGGAGDDTLTGSSGVDVIAGGVGSDAISGGTGSDTVSYAGAANTADTGTQVGVVVNLGATALTSTSILSLTGDFTADSVTSVASNTATYLYAGAGATNSAATDTLNSMENVVGTAGTDYIVGSATANTITGGAGVDTVTGGLGADTFVFNDASATDVVTDFTTADDVMNFVQTTFALESADADLADTNEAVTVAGAVGDLSGSLHVTNDLIILTDTTGFTNANLVTSIDGKAAGDALIIYFDSATSLVTMAYDDDINDGTASVDIATFSGIAAADIATSIAVGDFVLI